MPRRLIDTSKFEMLTVHSVYSEIEYLIKTQYKLQGILSPSDKTIIIDIYISEADKLKLGTQIKVYKFDSNNNYITSKDYNSYKTNFHIGTMYFDLLLVFIGFCFINAAGLAFHKIRQTRLKKNN